MQIEQENTSSGTQNDLGKNLIELDLFPVLAAVEQVTGTESRDTLGLSGTIQVVIQKPLIGSQCLAIADNTEDLPFQLSSLFPKLSQNALGCDHPGWFVAVQPAQADQSRAGLDPVGDTQITGNRFEVANSPQGQQKRVVPECLCELLINARFRYR